MKEVSADAVIFDAGTAAVERFQKRIREIELAKGIKFLTSHGRQEVEETKEVYTISNGGEARNPTRDLRRLLGPISGRQWVKFKKRARRYEKSKAVKGLVDGEQGS